MTRTILFTTRNAEVNPMFVKLRDKYTYQGVTVGEMMRRRAREDGYSENGALKSNNVVQRDFTAESRITKANSLPRSNGRTTAPDVTMPMQSVNMAVAEDPRAKLPLGTILMLALCATILMLLIYVGMNINNMTHEIASMNEKAAELKSTQNTLVMQLDEKNDLALIENIAKNDLGMVRKNALEHKYVSLSNEDSAVAYDTASESNPLISGLLSAFSEGFGK